MPGANALCYEAKMLRDAQIEACAASKNLLVAVVVIPWKASTKRIGLTSPGNKLRPANTILHLVWMTMQVRKQVSG
jgi:hypothetical protein